MINWVDILIILVLLYFSTEGLGQSLFTEIFDLSSFIVAFLASLKFYNLGSERIVSLVNYLFHIQLPHSFSKALGFIAIWYLIEISLYVLAKVLLRTYRHRVINYHHHHAPIFNVIPGFLKGLIFASILLVLAGIFPVQPTIKKAIDDSYLGPKILSQTYQLERPLKGIFGDLSNDTLSFLTVKPKTDESVSLGFKTSDFYFDQNLEQQMIDLVNQERVNNNLAKLTFDPTLRAIARPHSADMFTRGYFSHYSPEGESVADRSKKVGYSYLVIGENLAYAPSLKLAHQGLMNSPGHRANILSPDYHQIGIGVANGKEYGIMFTQVFSD